MHEVPTTYVVSQLVGTESAVKRPFPGRTYRPALGSTVSRGPPISAPSGSASVFEGPLAQGPVLPEGGGYKVHGKF